MASTTPTFIIPVPIDAPPPPPRPNNCSGEWEYRDHDGRLRFIIRRFDRPDGGKDYFPLAYTSDGWVCRRPAGLLTLYGLETILDHLKIIIVEGEKAADAARKIVGGAVPVLTWCGGASNWKQTNYEPIRGKTIVLCPDADEPGLKAMTDLAPHLSDNFDCKVLIVTPPADKPRGWDIADALVEGWSKAQLFDWIKHNAVLWTPPDPQTDTQADDADDDTSGLSPQPVPFDRAQDLPTLTHNVLPFGLSAFTSELEESLQLPSGLSVMGVLGGVSAAERGKYEVKVRQGYTEPLNLYIFAPAEPSARKSPMVKALKAPLISWEIAKNESEAPQILEAASIRSTIEASIKGLRAKAGSKSGSDLDDLGQEILDLERSLPEILKPTRLFIDDATPEAMAAVLADCGGKGAILEAEGGIIETIAGRYSSGKANLDLTLKAYSREPTRIDRKGGPSFYLPDPQLTLALFPQPCVLSDRSSSGTFRGRGLDARFLYYISNSRAGHRKIEPLPVSSEARDEYAKIIHRILDTAPATDNDGKAMPHQLELSAGAYDLYRDFATEVERQLNPDGGELRHLPDWGGKAPGQLIRIAGNLHIASHEDPENHVISGETMMQATAIMAVLVPHAEAAYCLMSSVPEVEVAKRIWDWIVFKSPHQFSARDIFQAIKCDSIAKMDTVWSGLNVLLERFLILELETPHSVGRGRPQSPLYRVNRGDAP